jgi:penicillin G amidase
VTGLHGPVEVLRDGLGVPHCQAGSEHDAFFAQGWAHAADRLWQMDYDRRRALGRSAAVTGPAAVSADVFYRRLGLAACAQRDLALLSPAAREMLEAYSAGVNAVIGAGPPAGADFAGGRAPERWEPWHCMLVFRVRHAAMGSAAAKLWRGVVREALGSRAAAQMIAWADAEHLACVPPGAPCRGGVPAWAGPDASGSNNWALAGSRTAAGLPLLAGDPHRPLEVPNVYVQGHLSCPEWDVLGLAIPGVPGFSHFGHNACVAWCITHAMVDDQDLYRYRDPAPARRRAEVIEVRGGEPVRVDAAATERGSLVADDLALAWTATAEPNPGFDAIPAMLHAGSVGELFEAMRPWVEPANNLIAADTCGTIGYLTRGRVPVRARQEAAWWPVTGEDPGYGWRGFVAFADLPRAVDPDGGFLFSANNRILAAQSGPYLGQDVAAPWRARRIAGTLAGLSAATVADMAALHRDVVSLPARRLARLLGDWAPLAGWDGRMEPGSTAAAAYSVLRRELAMLLLERSGLAAFVEHPWNRLVPGRQPEEVVWRVAADQLLAGEESLLGGWSWRRALAEAVARAERAWGGETWGALHATRHRHPLGRPELDPPSVPYGGDMDTVQASPYHLGDSLATVSGSVARYAFDLADWDRSGWVVPLGAAGDPAAPHAHDQQEPWRRGELLPAPYTRAAVRAAARERVALVPG